MKKQSFIFILMFSFIVTNVSTAQTICKNIYVWNFLNEQGKQDDLTRTITDEFENGLTQFSECLVLDRKDFSLSFEQNRNEQAILSLNDIDPVRKNQLKTLRAEIVVFGKIIYNQVNDLYVLKVKFQNIETSQILRGNSLNISHADSRNPDILKNKTTCFVEELIKGKKCESKVITNSSSEPKSSINQNCLSYFLSGKANFNRAYDFTDKDSVSTYYQKAISDLTKALECDSNNYDARIQLGLCFNNIGFEFRSDFNLEKAIAEYDKVLKDMPDNNKAMIRKIFTLNRLKRNAEMCDLLKKVNLELLSPEDKGIYNNLKSECPQNPSGLADSLKNLVPLYRYWNKKETLHFYTIDWNYLGKKKDGWIFEKVECYVFKEQQNGTVPLYRYWNAQLKDYFYTVEKNDSKYAIDGWNFQQIECYVYKNQQNGSVPLYRYNNTRLRDHFYTVDRNDLKYGYDSFYCEGEECYVFAKYP